MLQVGIVGLPNVGKSSLFNALTASGVPAENYPFCTVDPNVGVVAVPDRRLDRIRELTGSGQAVPVFIEFGDIAGLVKGASKGEGLGNQFLGHIREVDAIAHVLRCFEAANVTHVMSSVDPIRDAEIVHAEMALADLDTLERRMEKTGKKARSGERDADRELTVLRRLRDAVSLGGSPSSRNLAESDRILARELGLLTLKPVVYVANIPEAESLFEVRGRLAEIVEGLKSVGLAGTVIPVSAAIEAELVGLEPEDRQAFVEELGMTEASLGRLVKAAFNVLGLITFFSTNEKQTHAWTVREGTKAPEAAGVIHSDFERGFIRAEAIGFDEFVELGSMKAARECGAVRTEGKDYVVRDGDILLFRFNV